MACSSLRALFIRYMANKASSDDLLSEIVAEIDVLRVDLQRVSDCEIARREGAERPSAESLQALYSATKAENDDLRAKLADAEHRRDELERGYDRMAAEVEALRSALKVEREACDEAADLMLRNARYIDFGPVGEKFVYEYRARRAVEKAGTNNDQRGGGSSEGDGKASASVKQTAEEERPPIATARDAEPAAAPSFSVGDRVEYVGACHEWRGRRGSVVRAEIGRFTWVQFDDNKHLGSTACFSTGLRLLPPATTGGGK